MGEIHKAGWDDLKFVDFDRCADERQVMWAQNFIVEWVRGRPGTGYGFGSDHETILIFPDVGGRLVGDFETDVPPRSVAIAPRGRYEVFVERGGPVAILASQRTDLAPPTSSRDPRVKPVGRPFAAKIDDVRVFQLDSVPYPNGNPRLKFLQSDTMSINFVEYTGKRGRKALSPHLHTDFEQGSLTVTGEFLHHLRTEWGPNADQWREDRHMAVQGSTLVLIPPDVIHTTEGTGEDRQMLFDIFAPPREDFIAKGWVYNAAEYTRCISDIRDNGLVSPN